MADGYEFRLVPKRRINVRAIVDKYLLDMTRGIMKPIKASDIIGKDLSGAHAGLGCLAIECYCGYTFVISRYVYTFCVECGRRYYAKENRLTEELGETKGTKDGTRETEIQTKESTRRRP